MENQKTNLGIEEKFIYRFVKVGSESSQLLLLLVKGKIKKAIISSPVAEKYYLYDCPSSIEEKLISKGEGFRKVKDSDSFNLLFKETMNGGIILKSNVKNFLRKNTDEEII